MDSAAKLDHDIEVFLQKDFGHDLLPQAEVSVQRLAEIARKLSPETLLSYHRRLARTRVAQVRKELRRRLSTLQTAFSNGCSSCEWRFRPRGCRGRAAPEHGAGSA